MNNGRVIKIWSDIVEVEFKNELPALNHLLTTHDGNTFLLVKRLVDATHARAIVVYASKELAINDVIVNTNKSFMVPVGNDAKNNIYNFWGNPLLKTDKKPQYVEMNSTILNERYVDKSVEIVETGIKAIDFFMPILKGYKLGIFGGAGVGKTVLMKEIIFNLNRHKQANSNIFIGSGERSREAIELYDELNASNLMPNSVMFISKMNEAPGARSSIVPIGITAAEYLRDQNKENVLLFIDNIYRFIQAENEVSTALGKKPSVGGYQSTLESDVTHVQNRLFKNKNGSITSFQTIFLPMDDLSDPSAVAVFNHLDGKLVLSRTQAAKNIFPAFDPLASSTNAIDPKIIGQRHYDAIIETKKVLKAYKDLEDVILILGFDELDAESKIIVKKALQLEMFFTQNFFMTEHFTKAPGQFVPLKETVESVIRILEGKYLKQNPESFAYIGSNKDIPQDN
ncbi:MSC_0618 family F1-like ATPase beta subunit [Ureaplasma urealyticum]|uniref:ATP synthase F1, beta subunit family protein n=1 Tax=Ureaplasma urealyticum serovar 8 str. ATCC 27618 TaxID=626095 RepID=A0ABM9XJP0_UREUR|nr:F0F1 ATP synthase subunit beta [Ureaplasma urealyticum]EDU06548.1 ATP synthase F1, beta subunit family protein [Ureaplasma urealyticum serovar 5 str. ATCC 27817]EDU56775.1 ATP synthase F1, beta subunit family protein [Ureaplasma urealyticum serovar 7 str. ATCC 27819]EDU67291.1 ATP synthase F1, beta subunit family protein [Ureaplasma urealyticum serovar 11 str. ATCC 33695]EEH01371.1 ATP synthase F1, beta subunit family protein [Ureaplasma urealyticum serovar 8 str. ATCC 27618]